MVDALLVAAVTAAAAAACLAAGRRRRARRAPTVPVTVEEQERADLLAEIGPTVLDRLDDSGLWLPDGTSVDTLYVPLEQVGGDFLGSAEIEGDAVAFIGDVAGHGLDAAIVALRVKQVFGDALVEGATIEDAVTLANDVLRREQPGFATLFACRLGPDGELTFVNAGHVPPLVLDHSPPAELQPTGPMMGAVDHAYEAAVVDVRAEERVVAYTDGLTEAFGARGGLSEDEIRAVVAEPGRLAELHQAVVAKHPEPVRDDIAAFELTVGDDREEPPA